MIRAVGSGTGFYRIWFLLGAIFALLAAASFLNIWQCIPLALIRAMQILFLASFFGCCILLGMIFSAFHMQGPDGLDYILVLGAQVRPSGQPSRVLKSRLDTAAAYLEGNPETVCIVSGGQGVNEPCPEGDAMKEYLIEKGIDRRRIVTESKSSSTMENFSMSREQIIYDQAFRCRIFLKAREVNTDISIGIISNNFHMYRALQMACKLGFVNICGISAPSHPLYLPNNLLREILALLKFFIKG